LSESIRRNTHIRPTLASGEHGAPVQAEGLVVKGAFARTNYGLAGRALVVGWKNLRSTGKKTNLDRPGCETLEGKTLRSGSY
jgi:hypothetical protein